MPLSKAGLATLAFFAALSFWNDWFQCILFNATNNKNWDLGYLLYKILTQVQYFSQMSSAAARQGSLGNANFVVPTQSIQMALLCVATGPVIVIYPFFQRYFTKGMMIGAVKG